MVKNVMALTACFTCLTACVPSPVHVAPEIPPATRVRLLLPDSSRQAPLAPRRQVVIGRVVRSTADSIYLQLPTSTPFGVARAGVPIWVSRGVSRPHSALQAGAFMAMLAAATIYFDGPQGRYHQSSDAMVAGAIGFGVGGIIGALSPWERWRRLRAP
jgi:hypothetical protein